MNGSIIVSSILHAALILITALSLPFLAKKPLDIPPIVSVELIQIAEKTNIPYAPKAKKTLEKVKEKEKKLVSEQAPPKKVKKNKTKTVVSSEKTKKKIEKQKIVIYLAYLYASPRHVEQYLIFFFSLRNRFSQRQVLQLVASYL